MKRKYLHLFNLKTQNSYPEILVKQARQDNILTAKIQKEAYDGRVEQTDKLHKERGYCRREKSLEGLLVYKGIVSSPISLLFNDSIPGSSWSMRNDITSLQ